MFQVGIQNSTTISPEEQLSLLQEIWKAKRGVISLSKQHTDAVLLGSRTEYLPTVIKVHIRGLMKLTYGSQKTFISAAVIKKARGGGGGHRVTPHSMCMCVKCKRQMVHWHCQPYREGVNNNNNNMAVGWKYALELPNQLSSAQLSSGHRQAEKHKNPWQREVQSLGLFAVQISTRKNLVSKEVTDLHTGPQIYEKRIRLKWN